MTLQADTGADANAINKKTFNEIFPDVELEESTYILQNFDKRLIRPIGSFRCFLRWKGHKYRVKFEVMGIDTPNLLSRETTFLMGILKKCLSVEKAPNESNNQISSTSVSGHSVPLTEEDPLTSTEGVFSHSVLPMEDRSQMNCASISDTAETPDFSSDRVAGSNNPSLSITDLPLTQDKVETTYADVLYLNPLLRVYINQHFSNAYSVQFKFNFVQQCIQISTRINSSMYICTSFICSTLHPVLEYSF